MRIIADCNIFLNFSPKNLDEAKNIMVRKQMVAGVELILSSPDEIPQLSWIGGEIYMSQLLAAWTVVDPKHDIPMNPQILGRPGVGKTTLAYSAAKNLGLPVYIFQCTVDTRPEDLIISPVIAENQSIEYHASSLVSAMIEGGICILDEANRMAEKSWASLAPLLDQRRYIESIIAGIKIPAHPNFRICVTMNEDSSTFEIPEYIHSRLQPQIYIEFPDQEEEFQILQFNLPFVPTEILEYTVKFLQKSHKANKNYTVRDGINICRYYMKLYDYADRRDSTPSEKNKAEESSAKFLKRKFFQQAILQILGDEGLKFYIGKDLPEFATKHQFQDIFDRLNSIFFDDKLEDGDMADDVLPEDIEDDDLLDEFEDEDSDFSTKVDGGYNGPFDADDENEDEFIDIFTKDNKSLKKRSNVLEPIVDDEVDEDQFQDPNEIIRKFLKRKHSQNNGENLADKKGSSDKKKPKNEDAND